MKIRLARSFGERNPIPIGIIGSVAIVVGLLIALDVDRLPWVGGGQTYHAAFAEAAGLAPGDDVAVSGLTVGTVDSVTLDGDHVKVDFRVTDPGVDLGSRTDAAIVTQTVLGKRAVELTSAGTGTLRGEIPLSRTTSPYEITSAVADLATTVQAIDVASLTKALDTIDDTFQDTPDELRGAIHGLGRVSRTIASRDEALEQLLDNAEEVTGVLADRDREIARLLTDGSLLLEELHRRRDAIEGLLVNATKVSQQLVALVKETRGTMPDALVQLNEVLDLLNKNQQNIKLILRRVSPMLNELGDAVSSGPFFNAYIVNLTSPTTLLPVLSGLK